MNAGNDICVICLQCENNMRQLGGSVDPVLSCLEKLQIFLTTEFLEKCNINNQTLICNVCWKYIDDIYNFREDCIRNINTYKDYVKQLESNRLLTENEIKIEIEDDSDIENYDGGYFEYCKKLLLSEPAEKITETKPTPMTKPLPEIKKNIPLKSTPKLKEKLCTLTDDDFNYFTEDDTVPKTIKNAQKSTSQSSETSDSETPRVYNTRSSRRKLLESVEKPEVPSKYSEVTIKRIEEPVPPREPIPPCEPVQIRELQTCRNCNEIFADYHDCCNLFERPFTCNICKRSFRYYKRLLDHQKAAHSKSDKNQVQNIFSKLSEITVKKVPKEVVTDESDDAPDDPVQELLKNPNIEVVTTNKNLRIKRVPNQAEETLKKLLPESISISNVVRNSNKNPLPKNITPDVTISPQKTNPLRILQGNSLKSNRVSITSVKVSHEKTSDTSWKTQEMPQTADTTRKSEDIQRNTEELPQTSVTTPRETEIGTQQSDVFVQKSELYQSPGVSQKIEKEKVENVVKPEVVRTVPRIKITLRKKDGTTARSELIEDVPNKMTMKPVEQEKPIISVKPVLQEKEDSQKTVSIEQQNPVSPEKMYQETSYISSTHDDTKSNKMDVESEAGLEPGMDDEYVDVNVLKDKLESIRNKNIFINNPGNNIKPVSTVPEPVTSVSELKSSVPKPVMTPDPEPESSVLEPESSVSSKMVTETNSKPEPLSFVSQPVSTASGTIPESISGLESSVTKPVSTILEPISSTSEPVLPSETVSEPTSPDAESISSEDEEYDDNFDVVQCDSDSNSDSCEITDVTNDETDFELEKQLESDKNEGVDKDDTSEKEIIRKPVIVEEKDDGIEKDIIPEEENEDVVIEQTTNTQREYRIEKEISTEPITVEKEIATEITDKGKDDMIEDREATSETDLTNEENDSIIEEEEITMETDVTDIEDDVNIDEDTTETEITYKEDDVIIEETEFIAESDINDKENDIIMEEEVITESEIVEKENDISIEGNEDTSEAEDTNKEREDIEENDVTNETETILYENEATAEVVTEETDVTIENTIEERVTTKNIQATEENVIEDVIEIDLIENDVISQSDNPSSQSIQDVSFISDTSDKIQTISDEEDSNISSNNMGNQDDYCVTSEDQPKESKFELSSLEDITKEQSISKEKTDDTEITSNTGSCQENQQMETTENVSLETSDSIEENKGKIIVNIEVTSEKLIESPCPDIEQPETSGTTAETVRENINNSKRDEHYENVVHTELLENMNNTSIQLIDMELNESIESSNDTICSTKTIETDENLTEFMENAPVETEIGDDSQHSIYESVENDNVTSESGANVQNDDEIESEMEDGSKSIDGDDISETENIEEFENEEESPEIEDIEQFESENIEKSPDIENIEEFECENVEMSTATTEIDEHVARSPEECEKIDDLSEIVSEMIGNSSENINVINSEMIETEDVQNCVEIGANDISDDIVLQSAPISEEIVVDTDDKTIDNIFDIPDTNSDKSDDKTETNPSSSEDDNIDNVLKQIMENVTNEPSSETQEDAATENAAIENLLSNPEEYENVLNENLIENLAANENVPFDIVAASEDVMEDISCDTDIDSVLNETADILFENVKNDEVDTFIEEREGNIIEEDGNEKVVETEKISNAEAGDIVNALNDYINDNVGSGGNLEAADAGNIISFDKKPELSRSRNVEDIETVLSEMMQNIMKENAENQLENEVVSESVLDESSEVVENVVKKRGWPKGRKRGKKEPKRERRRVNKNINYEEKIEEAPLEIIEEPQKTIVPDGTKIKKGGWPKGRPRSMSKIDFEMLQRGEIVKNEEKIIEEPPKIVNRKSGWPKGKPRSKKTIVLPLDTQRRIELGETSTKRRRKKKIYEGESENSMAKLKSDENKQKRRRRKIIHKPQESTTVELENNRIENAEDSQKVENTKNVEIENQIENAQKTQIEYLGETQIENSENSEIEELDKIIESPQFDENISSFDENQLIDELIIEKRVDDYPKNSENAESLELKPVKKRKKRPRHSRSERIDTSRKRRRKPSNPDNREKRVRRKRTRRIWNQEGLPDRELRIRKKETNETKDDSVTEAASINESFVNQTISVSESLGDNETLNNLFNESLESDKKLTPKKRNRRHQLQMLLNTNYFDQTTAVLTEVIPERAVKIKNMNLETKVDSEPDLESEPEVRRKRKRSENDSRRRRRIMFVDSETNSSDVSSEPIRKRRKKIKLDDIIRVDANEMETEISTHFKSTNIIDVSVLEMSQKRIELSMSSEEQQTQTKPKSEETESAKTNVFEWTTGGGNDQSSVSVEQIRNKTNSDTSHENSEYPTDFIETKSFDLHLPVMTSSPIIHQVETQTMVETSENFDNMQKSSFRKDDNETESFTENETVSLQLRDRRKTFDFIEESTESTLMESVDTFVNKTIDSAEESQTINVDISKSVDNSVKKRQRKKNVISTDRGDKTIGSKKRRRREKTSLEHSDLDKKRRRKKKRISDTNESTGPTDQNPYDKTESLVKKKRVRKKRPVGTSTPSTSQMSDMQYNNLSEIINQVALGLIGRLPEPLPPSSPSPARETFPCTDCDMSFKSYAGVRRHYHCVHEQIRDIKCEKCPRSFSTKESLRTHLSRSHQANTGTGNE